MGAKQSTRGSRSRSRNLKNANTGDDGDCSDSDHDNRDDVGFRYGILCNYFKTKFDIRLVAKYYCDSKEIRDALFAGKEPLIRLHRETVFRVTRGDTAIDGDHLNGYSLRYFRVGGIIMAVLIDYIFQQGKFVNVEGELDRKNLPKNWLASNIGIPSSHPLYYFYHPGCEMLYELYPEEVLAITKFKAAHPGELNLMNQSENRPMTEEEVWRELQFRIQDTTDYYRKEIAYSRKRADDMHQDLEQILMEKRASRSRSQSKVRVPIIPPVARAMEGVAPPPSIRKEHQHQHQHHPQRHQHQQQKVIRGVSPMTFKVNAEPRVVQQHNKGAPHNKQVYVPKSAPKKGPTPSAALAAAEQAAARPANGSDQNRGAPLTATAELKAQNKQNKKTLKESNKPKEPQINDSNTTGKINQKHQAAEVSKEKKNEKITNKHDAKAETESKTKTRPRMLANYYYVKFDIKKVADYYSKSKSIVDTVNENRQAIITLHQPETKLRITRFDCEDKPSGGMWNHSLKLAKACGLVAAVLIDYLREDRRFKQVIGRLDADDMDKLYSGLASKFGIPKNHPLYYFYCTGHEVMLEHYPEEVMAITRAKLHHAKRHAQGNEVNNVERVDDSNIEEGGGVGLLNYNKKKSDQLFKELISTSNAYLDKQEKAQKREALLRILDPEEIKKERGLLCNYYSTKFDIQLVAKYYVDSRDLKEALDSGEEPEVELHSETKFRVTSKEKASDGSHLDGFSLIYFRFNGLLAAVLIDYLLENGSRFAKIEGQLDLLKLNNWMAESIGLNRKDPLYYFYHPGYEMLYEHYPEEVLAISKFRADNAEGLNLMNEAEDRPQTPDEVEAILYEHIEKVELICGELEVTMAGVQHRQQKLKTAWKKHNIIEI